MNGAIASTLHYAVKFKWNHQEMVIHRDSNDPIYTNQIVQAIKGKNEVKRRDVPQ